MKKGLLLTTLVTIALAFFSCSNDDFDFVDNTTAAGDGIEFRTLMDKPSNGLRAAITDESSILSFTVTGIKMMNGGSLVVADAPYLFNGFGITRGENSSWDYTPKRYWPKGLLVDFYAYSPSSSINVDYGITDYVAGDTIVYTVPQIDKKNDQEDFLVAKTIGRGEDASNSAVKLNFHHALSRATFYAKTTNTDVTYVVESVKLLNLNSTANLKLSTANLPATGGLDYVTKSPLVQWEKHSSMVNYTADMSEAPTYLGSEFKSMIGATNAILVMPQKTTLSTNGTGKLAPKTGEFAIEVSYKAFVGDIYYAGSPSKSEVKYFAVKSNTSDDPITFEMGRQYNFYLTFGDEIGGAIGFSVGVSDWTENAPTYLPDFDDYTSLVSPDFLGSSIKYYGKDSGGYSLKNPGKVTKADLAEIAEMVITKSDFDFTGIEYFENLKKLKITNYTAEKDLDFSKNSKLQIVDLLETSKYGTVNLSNTALTALNFGTVTIKNLDVSNTKITQYGTTGGVIDLSAATIAGTLNMSNCGLTKIDKMPAATKFPKELNLSNNALTTFDLSAYSTTTSTYKLNLSYNNLTGLTLPTSTYSLAELNLANNKLAGKLTFGDCQIGTLDVSSNTGITNLLFKAKENASSSSTAGSKIKIEKVNAIGLPALETLKFENAAYTGILLEDIDIRHSKNITNINVGFSKITKLTVWAGCSWYEILNKLSYYGSGDNKSVITEIYEAGGKKLGSIEGNTPTEAK